MSELSNYSYRGARALVLLHEIRLTEFLITWKAAKRSDVKLPATDDSDYQSLDTLLHHLFRSARGYMIWICDKLNLDDPQINPAPPVEEIEMKADEYLEYLLSKWRIPLAGIEEAKFNLTFKSNWNVEYSIEAMLEHAVMHPIRHKFQLIELMQKR